MPIRHTRLALLKAVEMIWRRLCQLSGQEIESLLLGLSPKFYSEVQHPRPIMKCNSIGPGRGGSLRTLETAWENGGINCVDIWEVIGGR